MFNDIQELRNEFLQEAYDLLDLMENMLLEIEQGNTSKDILNEIFRVAHTIKGGSAALELNTLVEFTHNLENLLDDVRSGKISIQQEGIVDIMLSSLDVLKDLINEIAKGQPSNAVRREEVLGSILQFLGLQKSPDQPKPVVSSPEETDSSASVVPQNVQAGYADKSAEIEYFSEVESIQSFEDLQFYLLQKWDMPLEETEDTRALIDEGWSFVHISLEFVEQSKEQLASKISTYMTIANVGQIVASIPDEDQILVGKDFQNLEIIVVIDIEKEDLYRKIFMEEVHQKIQIKYLLQKVVSSSEGTEDQAESESLLDYTPEIAISAEMVQKIETLLTQNKHVYQIRIWLNTEDPMYTIDALLILQTLEGTGSIMFSSIPEENIKKEEVPEVLEFIYSTEKEKEWIKEKLYTSDTIKELRIAFFELKERQGQENKAHEAMASSGRREEETGNLIASENAGPHPVISEEIASKDDSTAMLHPVEGEPVSLEQRFLSKEEKRIRGLDTSQTQNEMVTTYLKVESRRVDVLMNLIGELVISKAGLLSSVLEIFGDITRVKTLGSSLFVYIEHLAKSVGENERASLKRIESFLGEIENSFRRVDQLDILVNSFSRTINDLQERIMTIRMVPISSLFNRVPRIVRDISKKLGKQIRVEMIGEDTELDKSMIEQLVDPIVHIVRNSVDHGIETPDARIQSGKEPEGKVVLRAYHDAGMIYIEIQDDGKGLDAQKIRQKAIDKGLITPEQNLSVEDIHHLIFLPGFSTADVVTDISGRGVGMDVVRNNIQSLSGEVSVYSKQGEGSTFTIKLPLTLSIVQALIVGVKGYLYAFPINMILETIELSAAIYKEVSEKQSMMLEGDLVTIIDVQELFHIKQEREYFQAELAIEQETDLERELEASLIKLEKLNQDRGRGNREARKEDASSQVGQEEKITSSTDARMQVVQTPVGRESTQSEHTGFVILTDIGNKKVGFLVHTILSEQDIVVKPLHKEYTLVPGLSGATILGDGSIGLILDVPKLFDLFMEKRHYVSLG